MKCGVYFVYSTSVHLLVPGVCVCVSVCVYVCVCVCVCWGVRADMLRDYGIFVAFILYFFAPHLSFICCLAGGGCFPEYLYLYFYRRKDN